MNHNETSHWDTGGNKEEQRARNLTSFVTFSSASFDVRFAECWWTAGGTDQPSTNYSTLNRLDCFAFRFLDSMYHGHLSCCFLPPAFRGLIERGRDKARWKKGSRGCFLWREVIYVGFFQLIYLLNRAFRRLHGALEKGVKLEPLPQKAPRKIIFWILDPHMQRQYIVLAKYCTLPEAVWNAQKLLSFFGGSPDFAWYVVSSFLESTN